MDLMRLSTINFLPEKLIEKYSSLVWTERYGPAGDFQLKTYDIEETRKQLPIGSIVALLESAECAFVESHAIDEDEEGNVTLTVSGRTFETFFENRVARGSWEYGMYDDAGNSNDLIYANKTPAGMAKALLDRWSNSDISDEHSQTINNFDVRLASDVGSVDMGAQATVQAGHVYERALEFLSMSNLGIRTIRPGFNDDFPNLTTYIYRGEDKSGWVIFSTSAGHFVSKSYVWSNVGHKNMVWTYSYYRPAVVVNSTGMGLTRRVGYLDASDMKSAYPHSVDAIHLRNRGRGYLKRNKRTAVFDGQVSTDTPYFYGQHYDLGDTVKIKGDYGVEQDMVVTEYIRIEDENGERGYPSLEMFADAEI